MVRAEVQVIAWGTKVRFNAEMAKLMGPQFGGKKGVVTGPPIGSRPEPEGGLWVLWDGLREPALCFEEDLEVVK